MNVLLAALLTVFPVHAQEAERQLSSAVEAVKKAKQAPIKRQAPSIERVTDAPSWSRLVERVEARPHRVQTIKAGGTTYKVSVVTSNRPVIGQDCPDGTTPQNSVFVSRPTDGQGQYVVPVRLSASCVGKDATRDSFSLAAGFDGKIMDAALFNGSLGIVVSPLHEPLEPAEPSSLAAFLARLVKQLTDAP